MMNESEYEYWFRKRMEDIPQPVVIGKANLTEDEIENGRKRLLQLIEESKQIEKSKKRGSKSTLST